MLRTVFSFRGLILVFGLVAVGLPIALVGELGIVRTLDDINNGIAATREGSLATADVLEYQLDEETAIAVMPQPGGRSSWGHFGPRARRCPSRCVRSSMR